MKPISLALGGLLAAVSLPALGADTPPDPKAPARKAVVRIVGAGAQPPIVDREQLRRLVEEPLAVGEGQLRAFLDPNTGATAAFFGDLAGTIKLPQIGKQIDLDLDGASVRDAVRKVAERASLDADVEVADDVPGDARVTVKAKTIRVSTALDLIAQAGGANWSLETKDNKTVIKVGKSVRPGALSILKSFQTRPGVPGSAALPHGLFVPKMGSMAGLFPQRYTFTCPHCKGHVAGIRETQQPACPKCSRVFQPDWKFCPVDGGKRPPTPGEWRYCPLCGKQVEIEKT